jgi:hypothetical protein
MGRYTIPELLFVPEFHTGTYHYILTYIHLFFLIFLTVYPCFAFKIWYTGASSHFEHCLYLHSKPLPFGFHLQNLFPKICLNVIIQFSLFSKQALFKRR